MSNERIVVVGLGYVGLPLAVALARKFEVIGLDRDRQRVAELREGKDRTREVLEEELKASSLRLTDRAEECGGGDVYIVTVPTPVDAQNRPDLGAVLSATSTIAGLIDPQRRPTIIYESTVYPGVTEDLCGPEIERLTGFKRGRDFRLGYSPERINPGDREHTVDRIIKVIAGEDEDVVEQLAEIYGSVTSGGVFRAASIKAAEAAKAIENAQRDINIAFVNEVAMICQRLGISVHDVLDAARTKWNFLDFQPGLVGGHCIGVDPYYLAHKAAEVGHHPRIILAGRTVNDAMPAFIAECLAARLAPGARILALGLTFKENVPDLRNSKTAELILTLGRRGFEVAVHDPLAAPAEAAALYGLELLAALPERADYDALLAAVPHRAYARLDPAALARLLRCGGLLADLKGLWRHHDLPEGMRRWTL
jgi:UDP-N-acetyl-D-glucosamine/UDP-N-acetyl-D-galactosamine dehydrogenase